MEGGKKEISLQDMFQALMDHEGRGEEYLALHKKLVEEDGKWGCEARLRWTVMDLMGYKRGTGPEVRRKYYETFCIDEHEIKEQEEAEQTLAAISELEKTLAEIKDLPPVAAPALELEWVRGHPAMMRKDLKDVRDNTPVRLSPDDILAAPHGLPPSRSAVYQLVSWANRPAKFNEQLLGVNKRAEYVGADAGSRSEEGDMTLSEIRELLKQFAIGK